MRQSFSAYAFKAFGLAFALFVLALSSVHAAGLGKLTVLSSLGHPLNAEIELTSVAKDEADSIVVSLATPDAFKQANLEYTSALNSLSFSVQKRGDRHFVRVTSGQALNEPFIGMLLDLRSNSGRISREYTFLLDPVDLRKVTPAVAAAVPAAAPAVAPAPVPVAVPAQVGPADVSKTAVESKQDKPVTVAAVQKPAVDLKTEKPVTGDKSGEIKAVSKTAAAKTPEEVKPKAAVEEKAKPQEEVRAAEKAEAVEKKESTEHKVKRGDTLSVIATKYKYEDVSLEQMLVSIYRANPEAFVAKNMNRLRVGRVLKVPDEEVAGSVTKSEAKKVIVAHASDFAAYRNKLAAQVAKAAAQGTDATTQAAGGQITAKVEDKTTARKQAQDKLKLSKVTRGAAKTSPGLSAEDQTASTKAIADERARVQELEKNINELQRVLELKNQDLAAQQKQAELNAAAKAAAAKLALEKAAAEKAAEERAAGVKASAERLASEKAAAEKLAELRATADKAAAEKAALEKSIAEKAAMAQKGAASVPPGASLPPGASAPKKVLRRPIMAAPAPVQKSFVDEMLDMVLGDIMVSGGIAGALVLLLGFLFIRARSKKKSLAPLGGSLVGDSRESPNSLFGSAGGQSVDTNNSIFNSGFTPSASLLDANEVDPVAEADVYIAYGREAQAIEILKEALRAHPERNALRVKLLEIYASQKDVQAFDLLAGELYGLTRGEGEEWIYAAGLGIAIDPTNPLFAGGDMSEELLNRPTSLQGSLTQPRDDNELEAQQKKSRKQPDHLGYEFVQPSREQVERPDLPLDLGAPPPSPKSAPMDFDMGTPAPKAKPSAAPPTLEFDLGDMGAKKDQPSTSGMTVSESSTIDFTGSGQFKPSATASQDFGQAQQLSAADREFEAQLAAADRELASIKKVEPYSASSVNTMKTSQPETTKPAGAEFDFGAINLDLAPASASASASAPAPALAPAPAPQQKPKTTGASAPVDSAEMDTKIELAAAYFGIGDKEGARELLDEVMQDGTPDQVKRAKESLAKFA